VPAKQPVAPFPADWPWRWFGQSKITDRERQLLMQLSPTRRVTAMRIPGEARDVANELYPERLPTEPVDRPRRVPPDNSHANAFVHAYMSARFAQEFGPEWSKAITTAHETANGNRPPSMSMDLFNNDIGRQVAAENPGVDSAVLAMRIRDAIAEGRTVVVDANGSIRYSNTVPVGHTGH
jgi:hypothetical protein